MNPLDKLTDKTEKVSPDESLVKGHTTHPDQCPAGTRIQREGSVAGECVWHVPAKGKYGNFLFVGLFWTLITAVVTRSILFNPVPPLWFGYPLIIVFWAISFGCLYIGVRNKYARHRIAVTQEIVTLRREMLGMVKVKSLATRDVQSVEQTIFYHQNYQPVYGVEIRARKGKLRFGSMLEAAEKAWLVEDIKRAVFRHTKASEVVAISPDKPNA